MKNYSYIVIATGISLSSSTALFADAPTTNATKSYFAKSSVSNRSLKQEPVITNEAEYAELVRKNEKVSQASSAKSAPMKTSKYSTASASSNQTK